MKSMKIKDCLCAWALAGATCLVCASARGATDSLWIGGASGNWNDVNNWSGAVVPNGADAVARIESASDVTISVGSGTYTVGAIHASGGNHKIDGGTGTINFNASSGTGVVDVAENVTLAVNCQLDASASYGTALAKTGLGTILTTNQVGRVRPFNGIDVREGTYNISHVKDHTDGVRPGGRLTVRSGATAKVFFQNLLANDTVIDIESGGVFDFNGKGDLINAITGGGEVRNAGTVRLGLKGGPHVFRGRVTSGIIQLYRITSITDWGYEPDDSKRLWVLGTPDGLANADITFSSNLPGDRLLSFEPGLGGAFSVKHIDYTYGQPLVLEDTEGNPVTVRTTPGGTALKSGRIIGGGSFTLVSGANTNIAQTNGMVSANGVYGWTAGTNTFGTGTAAHDAVVTSLAAVDVPKGAVLVRRNATNEVWDATELVGMGTVIQDAPSDWSLPLSMTGGTFRVTARAGANEVAFSGGNSTNVTLDLSAAPAARIAFTGGTHHFPVLSGEATRTYRQTGGTVYAGPLSGHVSAASQSDIFYTMTGGTLYSTTLNNYARGIGLDMSGDAEAYLRFGGGSKMYHRLASDGESHTIRLRDNALLDVDWMHLGSASSAVQTPAFDLQGGTFQVSGTLSLLGYSEANYANYTGSFILNGGLVRSTAQDSWCTWELNDKFTAYVGANGARFDVPRDHWGRSFYFKVPLLTGVSEGVDGGVEKTGTGWFIVYKVGTYTGPTRVLGGSMRTSDETQGAAPFGMGSVVLENGTLLVTRANDQRIATAPGATVTYRGGSLLGTYANNVGQLLTLGPADAEPGSVLVRGGHGVLGIMPRGVTDKALGVDEKFVVNGGVPLDAQTGLVAAPVFGYLKESAFGWWALTFLTYDDAVGFKEPAYVEGLGGGNTSVARISGAVVTLTADAHVGALDLRYASGAGGVSIASGATLTVGNGAGTIAPILMNNYNKSAANAYQSIIGAGSLDFGAAEGLVVCNQNRYWLDNASWFLAARIACAIKGSGGVTFAGLAEHSGHSDLELRAANTYSGGTWIEHLCVKPMVNGAFSSGAVTVDGNMSTGGGIWIPQNSAMTTLPNAISLSGNGRFVDLENGKNLFETFGALRADRTVNVTGAVTLPADARISALRAGTRLTLSGGVSGAGRLFVSGGGTVVLPTANAYAGGTTVEGVLEVQDAAALGTGPVTVAKGGTLRFANASPLTVANAITGEGAIEFAGSAPVTLTAADGFAGTRRATGGVTTAGYDLVKEGGDTLTLTAANTYGGETRVLGGTLALGPRPPDAPPCPEAIFLRLDADDAGSRTMDGGNVVAWADADGRGITFTNSVTDTAPVLNEGAINGRDSLFFGGLLHRMVSDKGVAARTVFIVNKFQPKDTPHPNQALGKSGWNCAGIFGNAGQDCGIRVDSAASGEWRTDDWTAAGDIYCNGEATKSFLWGTPQISTFALATVHEAALVAVGDYWRSTSWYRGFYGDVAEVLVYDRQLDDAERQAAEAYLGAKWGIAVAPAGVATNVLPVATDVTVADGAALDLAGRVQTVASIAGAGAVTNSSLSQATLALGALDGFAGTLSGNVRLEVTGTTTLSADATIDPGIDLHLAPGAILDLNGRTITVRNASGSGFVRNGTLVVTGVDSRMSPATASCDRKIAMKIRLAGFVVAGCLAAAGDSLWVGGASGDWGDAKNWSGGAVPNGADAVARIESATDVTISVWDRTYTVGAIRASGGRHMIVGTGFVNLNASCGTGVVEVAENAWLTAGCRLDAAVAKGAALAKTGRGVFEVANLVGRTRALNGIDVREGAFNFHEPRGGDHINPGGRVTVRAGATANLMTSNLLVNDTVVDVKAGGTFDANGKGDLIAAIVGEGLVTNSANLRLTLKGGPHVFSGRLSGRVTLERWKEHSGSLTDIGYEPDDAKRLWVVGTRDGLRDATVGFVSDLPDDRPLAFAPNAGGPFAVGAIEFPRGKPYALKDTAGKPVEVLSPPPVPEREFRLAQLRAECARFNAAAAARALDDLAKNPAYDAARHRAAVKAFAARRDWVAAHLDDADEAVREEAVALVEGYRAAFLANPALDFDRILCVRRRMPLPKNDGTRQLGLQDINAHNHMRVQRTGFMNDIAIISNLRGKPSFTTVYKPDDTSLVRDLDLDFDASRVSFTKHRGNDMWGVFEIELGPDGKEKGSGCVEVSPRDYPDVHWANGCYLPNRDQVIVLGSGVYQYLPCEDGNMPMMVLYRIDRKTGEVRQLTYEQDSDYTPSVLNDGRVVFTRWEYSDMQHYFARELMTMNPDGVGQLSLWGSGSYFPTFFYKARAIPDDPHRLVMIGGGHHGVAEKGRMLLVDPSLARAYPYRYDPPSRAWGPTLHKLRVPAQVLPASQTGLVQEFPGWGQDVEGDVCDLQVNNQFDRGKPYMSYPYPLDGKYYLATCQMEPLGRFGIYLVDVFDNMILLAEAPDGMLFEPIPLRARKRPPVIPDRSDPSKKDCTVHIADIHAGPGLAGVPRGTVKKLRLFAYHFNYHRTGGHVSIGLDRAEAGWDIKRVLGTVDVEADGSCCFRMPARLPVSIQPLDGEGRAVQLMRSWVVGMPGERVSCTGCHEDNRTSVATGRKQADLKPIQEIVPMDGDGVRPFAFATEMWPLLQKRCGACHGNPATAPVRAWDQGGDGKSARLVMRNAEEAYRFVHPYVRRPGSESELPILNPMEYHASTSPLVQMLKKGHHGVALDDAEWRVLYTWIDLNAPWKGKWNPPEPEQRTRRLELSRLFGGNVDDPEAEYDRYAAIVASRLSAASQLSAPSGLSELSREVTLRAEGPLNHLKAEGHWPMSELDAFALQAGRVDQRAPVTVRTIELGGGCSMTFRRIPAGTFVMGSPDGAPDETPCVVTIERPFWMSETEVRNDQFRVFDPTHDSRHQDQYGFDQVVPGFVGTHRNQPAVRLTWNEAMAFCRWLSKKTGVKANLPTEAQWEWAARAGTATPFPWGGLDVDFSKHANLADRDVRFIYSSWDGPATIQRRREYKHALNYPLHEERFVDDWFTINYVARGLPNTWGLYDMHGNAAEWTRSAYRPYPYRSGDGREDESAEGPKAVRGGSFASRPRNATSSFRQAYLPWQKVFDTGFRVVLEDD